MPRVSAHCSALDVGLAGDGKAPVPVVQFQTGLDDEGDSILVGGNLFGEDHGAGWQPGQSQGDWAREPVTANGSNLYRENLALAQGGRLHVDRPFRIDGLGRGKVVGGQPKIRLGPAHGEAVHI